MDVETFLTLMEIPPESGKFVLCPFDPGITLLKQQTRALNLLFALRTREKLREGSSVLVIGGGVAGVTAAAAAAKLGCVVTLMERMHTLVHLQNGCDTRWLHPHIYDWPASNAQRIYAELPLLDWRAASASSVAKQIVKEFESIRQAHSRTLTVHTGVSITEINNREVKWENQTHRGNDDFDVIIFAVGFGVEKDLYGHSAPSYWRNDSLHQSDPKADPNKPTNCLITGTGDGGLIDLMRATLSGFNHETIHQELFHGLPDLEKRLLQIKRDWTSLQSSGQEKWLYKQYNKLNDAGLLRSVTDRIRAILRKDIAVTLHGRRSFEEVLSLDSASMFSTLVAYCLSKCRAFDYKTGELSVSGSTANFAVEPIGKVVTKHKTKVVTEPPVFEHIVVRHGADLVHTYESALCPEVIQILKSADKIREYLRSADRLWAAGWWESGDFISEYVSRPTCVLATTFVSTLRDMVELAYSRNQGAETDGLEFRITMHRLTEIQGNSYYQQIARYAGTDGRLNGKVGRIFPVGAGLGGLCCRIGRPVIITSVGKNFEALRKDLGVDQLKAAPIDDQVQSFLTVPFFATSATASNEGTPMVLLLYADSNRTNFFSETVLETIYSACRGFVGHVERMINQGEICFLPSETQEFVSRSTDEDKRIVDTHKAILATDNSIFGGYKVDLTFKAIQYFEVAPHV